jgi:hypothetical protein
MFKNKKLLSGISIFLIAVGILLMLPFLHYFFQVLDTEEIIHTTTKIINTALFILGLFADIAGVAGLSKLFKKGLPALTDIPTTYKGRLEIPLIGRESNLSWLQSISKDCLVSGQPGSGKTYLLYQFAKDNRGLFIDRDDIDAVIHEYKKKKPKYIIVDDGQFHLDLLDRLLHYRKRKKEKFIIVVCCWPSYQDQLAESMNLNKDSINQLNELTRDEIVQIIKYAGIEGPDDLVREIVNQSSGRPGLAITLTDICLDDGVEEVIFGNALTRNTTSYLSKIVGDKAKAVLAAFAVGGSSGLEITAVAEVLKVSLPEVQTIVTKAASGILYQTGQRLAVYPPVLRFTLVRDIFFGSASLPIELLIDKAPSIKEVGETLIGAKARGANIPWTLLSKVLQKAESGELWGYFSGLGKEETIWVLNNHPEYLLDVANSALDSDPETAIPLLLNKSIGDNRQLSSTVDHPLRLLEDWVISAYPGTGEAIQRRKHVFDAVNAWLKTVDQTDTAYRAIKIALSPKFQRLTMDPGSNDRVTIHYGSLTLSEVIQLEELWIHVLSFITQYSCKDIKTVIEIIEMWVYPTSFEPIKPEVVSEMKSEATRMLKSLLPILSAKPGFLQWAHRLSVETNMDIYIKIDSILIFYIQLETVKKGRNQKSMK